MLRVEYIEEESRAVDRVEHVLLSVFTRRRWRGARRARGHLFVEKAFISELDAVGEQKIDSVYLFSTKFS
jgi:hypothetical protein